MNRRKVKIVPEKHDSIERDNKTALSSSRDYKGMLKARVTKERSIYSSHAVCEGESKTPMTPESADKSVINRLKKTNTK